VRYGSRNFRIDLLYYVFYYSGLYHVLFFLWVYRALEGLVSAYAPWLQMNLLRDMSPAVQVVVLIVTADFLGYWAHRARHASAILWAFHKVHHSQTILTAVTNYRFHIVDETFLRLCLFIPFQILGPGVEMWLHRPRVADFESLRDDVLEWRGWWRNRVSRTLLVFMLTNFGMMIGEYLAGIRILNRII